MAELRKIKGFIDLISKNRVNDKHDFKNFADRLSKFLLPATNEILTPITRLMTKILIRADDLPGKFAFLPIIYPAVESYPSKPLADAGCKQVFPKIAEFHLPRLAISFKVATFLNDCVGICLKVTFPLNYKLHFKFRMAKAVPKKFRKNKHRFSTPKKESKTVQPKPQIRPIFKPEEVQTIFDLLKNFFAETQHASLHQVLKTGNSTDEPLLFLDCGNRLADAFKQLINAGIITGCEKKELENWIFKNFRYRNNQKFKEFSTRYLNDIVSSNDDDCSNPILNVTRDK
ncbi:MAG TPA: hypothetical protein VGK38_04985, partial [Prolixibacteraceae bacterium]